MIRLIIFDLDDTLYPEMDFVKSGFRNVSEALSRDFGFQTREIYCLLINAFNEDRKLVFNRVLNTLGINDDAYLTKIISIYRTHEPKIQLYPDAEKMLPFLKKNFLLGLVTDGFPVTQKLKIEALNIEKYFNKIIYTWEKDGNYSKPSVLPFKDMLDEFGIMPAQAVYIGDNVEKDFKGPKDLGMLSIRIARNDGIYKDIITISEDFEPDYSINSLLDVANLLAKL